MRLDGAVDTDDAARLLYEARPVAGVSIRGGLGMGVFGVVGSMPADSAFVRNQSVSVSLSTDLLTCVRVFTLAM